MQRIYGTAFFSDKDLQAYVHRLEEAKKRDHRKIGRDQKLFMFHPWAPGATFWLGKGTIVYNTLADYMRGVLAPAGYVEVKAPIVFNKALWETSGHWQHYRQNMFLVESEGEQMGLKAMNCPGHFLMYASEVRSYRDLPIRFHEQTPLHRNEASGVLSGLTRVRQFSQDDAHCFVMESQIGEEVERLLRLVQRVYADFGLTPEMKLSTRPPEFLGTVETWNHAEAELKRALEAAGAPYTINQGDGAFYGPKIDFDVTDAIGRKWQCATIQLDYMQAERFDLTYIGADNAEHRPVIIHRAILGSFERFIALLIEHFAGAWPLWLAPVQAVVLPISDRHLAYARSVTDRLASAGLRVELDDRQEKIGYKIREAQLQKVPYMLVTGDREAAERYRFGAQPLGRRSRASRRRRIRARGTRRNRAQGFRRQADCAGTHCSGRGGLRFRHQSLRGGVIAFDRSPRRDDRTRINDRIRVREIRVIDETGQQLGIMAPPQALVIAKQKGLDLVEISPTAVPPVCRIMDFGKYQYQEQKRSREAKKHQRVIEVKEIKFRPKVDEHDYQFKKKHIERFLADGDKVKATIFFRGREMAHPDIGQRILERLMNELADVAMPETMPRQEGNQMHVILSQRTGRKSAAKPRSQEAPEPATTED